METKIHLISEIRNEVLWLYAALAVERTVSAVLGASMIQGRSFDDANRILASILKDRETLCGFFDDDREYLIGATESDWELMLDEYIPALLKSQIDDAKFWSSLEQEDSDETLATIVGRRRKMGFAPK
ncbi:MAG: hypothetical protein OXN19_16075 [Caldilineaceae bacterium]|nr:hypothetical protein [Caldilineaceae bacterium]